MRKIWDRFRKWLIRKLGGYTEVFDPGPGYIETIRTESHVEKLCVCTRINMRNGLETPEYISKRIEKAVYALGKELLRRGFISVKYTDWPDGEGVYEVSVRAVVADDSDSAIREAFPEVTNL